MSDRIFVEICENQPWNAPICPKGHGPMMLVEVTQGEKGLGRIWFCVNNDYTEEPKQLEMAL